jgi:hypothetical protein
VSLVDTTTGEIVDRPTFADHEKVIADGLAAFVDVGNALLAIKMDRLYVEAGYTTFELYCQERWQMSARHGNRLIVGATIFRGLAEALPEEPGPIGPTPLPTVESQARPLVPVPADERPDVWRAAVTMAGGEPPTAAQVQAAVDDHLGIDREAGESDDREASVSESRHAPSPAREPAQHEAEGTAGDPPPPAAPSTPPTAPMPPRLSTEEQAELDHEEAIGRRRKNLALIHSNWPAFESLRINPDRAEILRGLVEHDRQFILELERRVSWKA